MNDSTRNVTRLLGAMRDGSPQARDELWPLVYDELRRLAGGYMKDQKAGHTLQATALVNEAYVKLVGGDVTAESRAEFFGLAARAMRSILVDHARGRARAKRGGGVAPITLDEALLPVDSPAERLIDLNDAIERLARQDERKASVVDLHFFGGLTYDEIAEHLGISPSTARADMRFARAWLSAALSG